MLLILIVYLFYVVCEVVLGRIREGWEILRFEVRCEQVFLEVIGVVVELQVQWVDVLVDVEFVIGVYVFVIYVFKSFGCLFYVFF